MENNLKASVQTHIQKRQLTTQQLEQLTARFADNEVIEKQPKYAGWYGKVAAFTGILVLTAIISLWSSPDTAVNRQMLVAEEVVINHLKKRPLEVQGSSLNKIKPYFGELDFVLQDLPKLAGSYEFAGGRYCSLQGAKAALLRLEKAGDHYQTLYQVPYDQALYSDLPDRDKGEQPLSIYARGVKVSLWKEKGLLFALTHDQ